SLTVASFPTETPDPGLRWLLRDVTYSDRAEQALRTEKAFADSLVEAAQAIVLVLDSKGRVVRANPYLRAVSGRTDTELLGQAWGPVWLPPDDRRAGREMVLQAVLFGAGKNFTGGLRTRSGLRRAVAWSAKALPQTEGSESGVLVLGYDI